MKYLILFGCLSLTGCLYQTVDQFDIQRAKNLCGGIDKIVEIVAQFDGGEKVACLNGKQGDLGTVGAE